MMSARQNVSGNPNTNLILIKIEMKVIFTILMLNSMIIFNGFSQQTNSEHPTEDAADKINALYLEYSGNAPIISLNYERNIFYKNKLSICERI